MARCAYVISSPRWGFLARPPSGDRRAWHGVWTDYKNQAYFFRTRAAAEAKLWHWTPGAVKILKVCKRTK